MFVQECSLQTESQRFVLALLVEISLIIIYFIGVFCNRTDNSLVSYYLPNGKLATLNDQGRCN